MKLLHLDDHILFSEGLSAVLQQRASNLTVLSAHTAEQAFLLLQQHSDIDVILIDLSMPGLDGLAFLDGMDQRNLFIPVAVLSATDDLWEISKALKSGASGFIPKTYTSEAILNILDSIIAGDVVVPAEIQIALQKLPSREPEQNQQRILSAYKLGQRQLDVLKLIQQGYNNDEVAAVLNLSKNTIKTHIRTLFSAFQVGNRIECIRYAERIGLIK